MAHRLVSKLSASDEAEFLMIKKLKRVCEFDYVSKLEGLYLDVGLSKDLNEKFKIYLADSKFTLPFYFQVQLYSSRYWPFKQSQSTQLTLPVAITTSLDTFSGFYNTITSGRKLQWLHNYSKGSISFLNRYIFQVSIYQIAVLLLYNTNDSYSIGELVELTSLQKDEVAQVLQSLVKANLLVLQIIEQTIDDAIADDAVAVLVKEYKNKKMRLNINVPLKSQMKKKVEELDETHQNNSKERQMAVQAAIVRIMKRNKEMEHQELVAEVLQQTFGFTPSIKLIKVKTLLK